MGYAHAFTGRLADAAAEARWMQVRMPDIPYTRQLASLVAGLEGRHAEALALVADVDVTPLDAHQVFHLAESFAVAGDPARALALWEHSVEQGFYPHFFFANDHPFLRPLAGRPEYARILARVDERVRAFEAR
jgi:hypothetical protein